MEKLFRNPLTASIRAKRFYGDSRKKVDSGGNNGRRTGDFLLKAGRLQENAINPRPSVGSQKALDLPNRPKRVLSSQLGDERAQSTTSIALQSNTYHSRSDRFFASMKLL
jgi:hypothetical protein